jgi:transposase-like protein
MRGHGSKFERKRDEAIAALLTQRNIEEAAKSVGISSNTLLKWMKDPEFDKAFRTARRATFGQTVGRLQQAAPAAATTLLKMLVDSNVPASVRVRAAECILNHAIKAIELEDIEARLTELERSTNPDKK